MHGFGFGVSRRRLHGAAPTNPYWQHDFTSGTLPAGMTFARASNAADIAGSGLVQTAANDIGRFTHGYDSANGLWLPTGLLLEPQATNLLVRSEDFSTSWPSTNCSIVTDATTAPDGTNSADLLRGNAASTVHFIRQNFSGSLGIGYSYRCHAKAAGYNFLQMAGGYSGGGTHFSAVINLTTGAIDTYDAIDPANIFVEKVANGFWRIAIAFLDFTGANGTLQLAPISNSSLHGSGGLLNITDAPADGTSGVYVWGAQVEESYQPTAYIKTSTAQVTRAADSLTGTLPSVISLFDATQGTLVIDGEAMIGTNSREIVSLDNGTANNAIRFTLSGGNALFGVTSGGASQASIAMPRTRAFKIAAAWSANDFRAAVNGTLGTADTAGTVPSGLTTLRIGSGISNVAFGGTIKAISYYPTSKSNSELQGLTA